MLRVIFTDLDGTLLDHRTYGCEQALPALDRIRDLSVPLIFVSSKTAAELQKIREELNLTEPFISENGGGIHFPAQKRIVALGRPYTELQAHLLEIGNALNLTLRSIDEMSPPELAALTGLSEEGARLAQQRNFDVTFIVQGEFEVQTLEGEVEKRGLKLTRGSRFFHLTGENDKGRAVRNLVEFYKRGARKRIETIGLGDSENDRSMLEEVDIPVIIPNPDSQAPLHLDSPKVIIAPSPGPAGWNAIVLSLLADV